MKPITYHLGANVRRLRKAKNWTQAELADRSGVSAIFLQNIELGKKWVSPQTVSALAKALKVRETALFVDCEASDLDPAVVMAYLSARLGNNKIRL